MFRRTRGYSTNLVELVDDEEVDVGKLFIYIRSLRSEYEDVAVYRALRHLRDDANSNC